MINKTKDVIVGLILILVALVVIAIIPFPLIWAVNVLLGLGIQYGFQQWVATWIVMLFTGMVKFKFR